MKHTKPIWDQLLGYFSTNTTAVFQLLADRDTVYTVMFFIACILSVVIIWIFKGSYRSRNRAKAGSKRSRSASWQCAT